MRAAVLHTLGEAPAYGDHPDPLAAPGRSLVAVTAAPLVPLDLLCASGTSYFGAPDLPYVPGVQGVGIVSNSETVAPGTPVWFGTAAGMAPGDGAMAASCAVADEDLVPIGSEIDPTLVAALGTSAIAAWMALTYRARMQPGEQVLVLGAGGAVGQSAIGAAKVLGARKVVGVCRFADGQERALLAGADRVVLLRHEVDELTSRLRAATEGGVDVVIDPVFGIAATAASRVLAPGGRMVNLGGASGDTAEFSSSVIRSRSASLLGYTNNALSADERRTALQTVVGHAVAGRLRVSHQTRPLSQVGEAWTAAASGASTGRVVLVP